MLDCFEILTTSGVVLWSKHFAPVGVNIINSLIKDVFIEENVPRSHNAPLNDASASQNIPYRREKYTLKWTTAKDLGLIFVAVYQSLIHLSWIDKLLDNVKIIFTSLYQHQFRKPNTTVIECPFDDYFDRQLQELETTAKDRSPGPLLQTATSDEDPELEQSNPTTNGGLAPLPPGLRKAPPKRDLNGGVQSEEPSPAITPDSSRPATPTSSVLTAKSGPGGRTSRKLRQASKNSAPGIREVSASGSMKSKKQSNKTIRRWEDDGMVGDGEDTDLDYSAQADEAPRANGEISDLAPDVAPRSTWGKKTKQGEFVLKDLDEEMGAILSQAAAKREQTNNKSSKGGLVNTSLNTISSLFRNVVGGKVLAEEDLAKPLKAMEDHLVRKNVARDAAVHLCASVSGDLIGATTPSFTSIDTAIRESMDRALSKILTPTSGSSLDLLRSISASRAQATATAASTGTKPRPYVISVVGVNGVGKSTTLAKLAFLLLHNNHRILVAAADTFRSGAVEQLRVHVRNLQQLTARSTEATQLGHIGLYERGYGKDAAQIARGAIAFAADPRDSQTGVTEEPYSVVLVDTAGRRHNDTRLMASLAPFAKAASPDRILMVGEALVGTDSVAQAKHFNESFGEGRGLDGFVVSKCDTVGEMVGTLVSLVWSTGTPVLAVGVGQHYGDLRGFRVEWARSLLLEGG